MNCSTQASLLITSSWRLRRLMPIELVMPSSHLVHAGFLSFTVSWRFLRLMPIELVMPSSHLIHAGFLSFTVSRRFHRLMTIELVMPSSHLVLRVSFSSYPQSLPASGSFPISWLFASGGQSVGVSASVSVLPMDIQGWFPFGLTSLNSLLSKWLSRVFSNTTIWVYQFFGTQPHLWSNSHMHTWLLEKL